MEHIWLKESRGDKLYCVLYPRLDKEWSAWNTVRWWLSASIGLGEPVVYHNILPPDVGRGTYSKFKQLHLIEDRSRELELVGSLFIAGKSMVAGYTTAQNLNEKVHKLDHFLYQVYELYRWWNAKCNPVVWEREGMLVRTRIHCGGKRFVICIDHKLATLQMMLKVTHRYIRI